MPPFSHLLLAAGLFSLSTGALAQPPEPPQGGHGAHGRPNAMQTPMTRTELKSMLEARFDKLDANRDGKLTAEDRDLARTERRDAIFAKLDTDKNGSLSKTEFETARRDGPKGPPQADGDKPSGRFMHANWRPRPMGAMMSEASKEPITKADFVAKGLERFDKIDTDHDGTISQAERDAARKAMRERGGRDKMPSPPAPPRG